MLYKGRLCPKVAPFPGFRFAKGQGRMSFRFLKGAHLTAVFKFKFLSIILLISFQVKKVIIIAFDEVEPNLACDSAQLVSLYKVIFWKTHIPVRTPKQPPRLLFAGVCHGTVQRRLVTRRTALWVNMTICFSLHDLSCCSDLWRGDRMSVKIGISFFFSI